MQSYIISDFLLSPFFSTTITIDGIPSTFDFDMNDIYKLNTNGKDALEKHICKLKYR